MKFLMYFLKPYSIFCFPFWNSQNHYTENHLQKTFAKIFSNDEMFHQYQPHEFLYHIKK